MGAGMVIEKCKNVTIQKQGHEMSMYVYVSGSVYHTLQPSMA